MQKFRHSVIVLRPTIMDRDTGILQLNDDCLLNIFQYADLKGQIRFALTCTRFRDVLQAWARRECSYVSLIGDIELLELSFLSLVAPSVKELNIFVDDLVSSFVDNNSGIERNNFVLKFCNLLRTLTSLCSVKLWQLKPDPIVKKILMALVELPLLRKLYLYIPKQEIINLGQFHRLEFVSINMEMSPRDLLRGCRSLTDLRTLHLSHQVSSSNLLGIVQQLPRLDNLSFHIDPSNGWGLLGWLQGTENSLTMLFDFLARERALQVLRINGQIRAENEAKSLASIKSLKSLDCSFVNPKHVRYLTELTALRSLRITSQHDMDISATYLEVIGSCEDLCFLCIIDYNIDPNFVARATRVLGDIGSKNKLHLRIPTHQSLVSLRKPTALDHSNHLLRSIRETLSI